MANHLDSMYFGWGWFLWLGVFFLFFSSIGNWGYTYRAHHKYSDLFPRSKAFDILDERFARGEITREDFTKMKSTIIGENRAVTTKSA
jgi:putative membrane protein